MLPSFNWSTVSGAGSYKLEISTSNTFNTVVQTINNITALPYSLPTALVDNTIYYWRVTTTNTCGTGAPSYTGIFKTGVSPCRNSTDVPKTISATGTPIVLSTIVIPASQGTLINDLNVVSLAGSHALVSDITVTLTSPTGTNVILFDQICNGYQNFNLNLDDEALLAIPCPLTGNQTSKPQDLLSAFDGQNSTGTWTLKIRDNVNTAGGSLTSWGLSINTCTFIASPISTTPWTQLCVPGNTSLTAEFEAIAYQWQINTGSGFANLAANTNYSGVNAKTLQISNAPSSFTGYQYRCLSDGVPGIVYTLGFAGIWNGSVSNAWENPANWNCNSIPDANTDVIINSGTTVVSSAAICRSITVNPAASINVKTGFKLTVVH
jgi:subtilisin-like proprotein convertase family protein